MCYSLILRNIICTCWCVLGQFQNYHTNMKRLDITLTKFIKLHDCIPVNVRFAVYTQNFLSLNSISWYKTNYYTKDSFRTHPLLLQLLVSEAGYFRIMVFLSLIVTNFNCFLKENHFDVRLSLLNYRHVKTTLTELFH